MKIHGLIVLVSASMIGFVLWKYNRHVQSPVVTETELEEQLLSSTPKENSTMSLRTVLDRVSNHQKNGKESNIDSDSSMTYSAVESTGSVYGGVRKDIAAISNRRFSRAEVEVGQRYFEELVKVPQTAKLYQRSKGFFGSSSEGDGAARWVTLGVVFESSPRYGNALEIAMQDANRNAESVLSEIDKSIGSIRRDPFIYQMTMNLVYKLDAAPEKQAEFYGRELEQQLQLLSSGKPTDSFWVSTLGLMFAQQAGVKGEALFPYLKRGLEKSKGSPQVLAEFKQSAMFYFPGMSL
jgi:hypothetical protein